MSNTAPVVSLSTAGAEPVPVPLLDINRQNEPLRDEILAAITEVVDTGAFLKGPAVRDLEAEVARLCGVGHAVGCASGTDAILVALMAHGVGPGDEVILPSFTFFATAGCVSRLGATPVFADILPDTFNIDPADIARRITPATKAILPVHLFGQAADMDAINALAAEHGLPVIEDAAQAIGADYHGRPIGSLGSIGCISFYPTKNLGGMGDGGMITTDDAELASRMRILCDHGQEPRYYHHMVGLNSRLDTIQAAALGVKLKRLAGYAAARGRHAARYNEAFDNGAAGAVVTTPVEAPGCSSVWNQYTVRVAEGRRDALQSWLSERKIGAAIYYPVPLHLQNCFADLGYQRGDLPHTERAAEEVLSLPVFPELTAEEQDRVIDAVNAYAAVTSVRMAA
ncbi:Aminotransferase [Botrimarina colliarenosi]|uniref:Aminotransferase n=1 Tax=Botrimarina colliarenosi TaxID=2528001 RepID=A0A5C6AET9_9BACT|nr:DegT/DnrJ/EryC1/StrS family aminotransferase [Botrimarina colliarenosi]TWT96743.1 Aminotransferase [Botrimarina colliarenosi]